VSGNAMAHVYVELKARERVGWPDLEERWQPLADALLRRPSVDLLLLPHSPDRCEVRSADRGAAMIERHGKYFRYRRHWKGDPLNYFIYPYAEADGKPVDATWAIHYKVVSSPSPLEAPTAPPATTPVDAAAAPATGATGAAH